jgi:signal transduction histidine kinase
MSLQSRLAADAIATSRDHDTAILSISPRFISTAIRTRIPRCRRVVQHAVTNVIKHAQATTLNVAARMSDHAATIEVSDDGIGFSVGSIAIAQPSAGLHALRLDDRQRVRSGERFDECLGRIGLLACR